MVQEFHSREFALFDPLPSPTLSLPKPPAAASLTQRSGLRRLEQGLTPHPMGNQFVDQLSQSSSQEHLHLETERLSQPVDGW